jgi:multidrug efflux pump subunit AcrB
LRERDVGDPVKGRFVVAAVALIVPMCMLSALAGVKLYGSDNNTFVQVGLVVLMGLACKNAIPNR